MSENLLEVSDLSFAYTEDRPILNNVSLDVRQGECVCLLGESGIGKTTLFRLIQGQIRPKTGTILYRGESAKNYEIATIAQHFTLFPHLSAFKNVEIVLRRNQNVFKRMFPDRYLREAAMNYLKQVNMQDCARQMPYTLSGGQKQRVAIAQALAQETPLILMDEPFGALDENIREELQSFLIQLQQKHKLGILFITHDLEEALYLGQRIYLLKDVSGTGASIEEYPVLGSIHDAPEIKQSEGFFKELQALRNHMYKHQYLEMNPEKIQHALQKGLIDESILSYLERRAHEIWVITPDLRQDVHNRTISMAVRENLEKKKRYCYVTPRGSKKAEENIRLYKKLFSEFEGQYRFITLPQDDPVYLFGEVVIYNPGNEDASGFTYLQGDDRGLMVSLPKKFLEAYVKKMAGSAS